MIAFLTGKVSVCKPTFLWMECGHVGYEVQISLKTFEAIKDKSEVFLYTYLQIKEDAHTLYGFFSLEEEQVFKQLIQISGISGSTARMILSSLTAKEIVHVIYAQDVDQLKKIKGIGTKMAERIILELKGKIHLIADQMQISTSDRVSTSKTPMQEKMEDALHALQALGITKNQAEMINLKIQSEITEDDTVEAIIKKALSRL